MRFFAFAFKNHLVELSAIQTDNHMVGHMERKPSKNDEHIE